ncbi:hypothetical protein V6N13_110537 [Hibiscus sabdariffa]|uniref:Uncharacterized protein n=1 Tax=Hibiscus sabdariffa TaxID=183260 RepID=A0ABR2THJ6_9ROSI
MDRGVVISSLQFVCSELKNLSAILDISIYASIDEQLCLQDLVEVTPLEDVGSREVSLRCMLALTTVNISSVDVAPIVRCSEVSFGMENYFVEISTNIVETARESAVSRMRTYSFRKHPLVGEDKAQGKNLAFSVEITRNLPIFNLDTNMEVLE